MSILKEKYDARKCEGFWCNRGDILKNKDRLTMIVDRASFALIGFYIATELQDGKVSIDMLQVFQERQGYGTMIIEKLKKDIAPSQILCPFSIAAAVPFWNKMGIPVLRSC